MPLRTSPNLTCYDLSSTDRLRHRSVEGLVAVEDKDRWRRVAATIYHCLGCSFSCGLGWLWILEIGYDDCVLRLEGCLKDDVVGGSKFGRIWEIVYPYIPDPDGEDEGGQASSSLAVSTRWISAAKLLQSDLTTLAQGEGGE
ncbi:hypothetical protein BHE74_00054029 [Ensete ventricosum]|nr:hypothetical protein BHE74_00054029 [Ensete ventricosum]